MAATLTQSIKERYDTLGLSVPGFYSGIQPEGTALTLPNFVFEHMGETPKLEADGNGRIVIADIVGRVNMTFFAEGMVVAESLATILQTAMEATPLTIQGDTQVCAERGMYKVMFLPKRGPEGQFIFATITPYTFMLNPQS